MKSSLAAPIVVLAVALAAGSADAQDGMRVTQSARLPSGSIQVIEDARISPALARRLMRGGVYPDVVLDKSGAAARSFRERPPRPARLRQIGADGRVTADIVLDAAAPLAWIEPRRLGSKAAPVFLVTADNDAGFGSYSGRVTALYGVDGGRLHRIAANGADRKAEDIVLVDTLKSGWRITDAAPDQTVIEQLLCRPDLDRETPGRDQGFRLTFITYRFDGTAWRVAKRMKPGFWESDDDWPPPSAFP